jgi:hypothetical protein
LGPRVFAPLPRPGSVEIQPGPGWGVAWDLRHHRTSDLVMTPSAPATPFAMPSSSRLRILGVGGSKWREPRAGRLRKANTPTQSSRNRTGRAQRSPPQTAKLMVQHAPRLGSIPLNLVEYRFGVGATHHCETGDIHTTDTTGSQDRICVWGQLEA